MYFLNRGYFYPMLILLSIMFWPIIVMALLCLFSAGNLASIIATVLVTFSYFALIWLVYKVSKSTQYYLICSSSQLKICYPNLAKNSSTLVIENEKVIQFEYFRLFSIKAWFLIPFYDLPQCVFMRFMQEDVEVCKQIGYMSYADILALAKQRGETPLVILCDGITDPHNLGAIIRSAEVAGAHGVIIPRRRSAGLNSACGKAAAGALEHLPVARVSNLAAAMTELKENGLFLFAADMAGENMYSAELTVPAGIVIGSEGEGLSRLVRESCDAVIRRRGGYRWRWCTP